MSEPIWLTAQDVIALHDEQLAIFGGPPGLRDPGMLESAIGRPRNKWTYGETDLVALAAAYGFGVARNHPFVDGNKRAAFAAVMVFLRINGVPFAPDPALATAATQSLAAGEVDEDNFARWIRDTWPKASTDPNRH
jgi:death on curing protein